MNKALLPANPPIPSVPDQGALWQWANYRSAAVLAELECQTAAMGAAVPTPLAFPQPVHLHSIPAQAKR